MLPASEARKNVEAFTNRKVATCIGLLNENIIQSSLRGQYRIVRHIDPSIRETVCRILDQHGFSTHLMDSTQETMIKW